MANVKLSMFLVSKKDNSSKKSKNPRNSDPSQNEEIARLTAERNHAVERSALFENRCRQLEERIQWFENRLMIQERDAAIQRIEKEMREKAANEAEAKANRNK